MLKTMVYFAKFQHMLNRLPTVSLPLFVFSFILALFPSAVQSQQPAQTQIAIVANSFVQDILARAGSPSAMAVSFQNVSQLPAESQEAAQDAISVSLRNAGVRLLKPEMATVDVHVTFSEDWQGYLWIAEIRQGPGHQLVMKRLQRTEQAVAQRTPVLALKKNSVWQQAEPILDFYVDNQYLVVLEPAEVDLYATNSGQWQQRATLAINHTQNWPRDLRGRLHVNGLQMSASLPGTVCSGSLSPPSLDCRSSDDPWLIDQGNLIAFYSSRRNFFNGILSGPAAGSSVIPFFSAATWPSGDQRQWLVTGADGGAHLYRGNLSASAAVFNGWGSNLAAIHSGCGSGWQLVASAATDSLHPDKLQAVEIAGRQLQPVSAAIDLAGAVSAMWTSGKSSETVNAVVQSPFSGKYEAIVLTVGCN